MLLKWNQARLKVVELLPIIGSKALLTRSQVTLLPGVNEVTDDEWELMKPHLQDSLKRKELETIVTKIGTGPGKSKEVRNLRDMPSNRALSLIKNTVDPYTLKKWEQEEERPELRAAIQKQMEHLKVEPEDLPMSNDETISEDIDESEKKKEL